MWHWLTPYGKMLSLELLSISNTYCGIPTNSKLFVNQIFLSMLYFFMDICNFDALLLNFLDKKKSCKKYNHISGCLDTAKPSQQVTCTNVAAHQRLVRTMKIYTLYMYIIQFLLWITVRYILYTVIVTVLVTCTLKYSYRMLSWGMLLLITHQKMSLINKLVTFEYLAIKECFWYF